ncbi:MAG: transmembrane 220 family protein [Kofleriaceae bacterium]
MAALLAVCVALQYNDPDPVRWMLVYGAGAAVSAVLPMQRRVALLGLGVGLATLAWGVYLVHDVWGQVSMSDFFGKMSEKGGAVEVEREAGGLLIQAVWLLVGSHLRWRRA